MKLKGKKARVVLVVVGALVICGIGGFLGVQALAGGGRSNVAAEAARILSLSKPAFAQSADAGATFLDEEAGMSIYTDLGQSLNLSKAKTQYRTVEKETSDYIVGSVSLPNLPVTDDVHCFVHKDGWIVVYYLKAEPVSKIIDWNYYSAGKLTKTKLQVGLENMRSALGVSATSLKYYHFQYPYASKWMIITESQSDSGTGIFNLKVPSEFAVYERSWSHYTNCSRAPYDLGSNFKLDENYISRINNKVAYGQLTASQLAPDVFHTVSVSCAYDNDKAHVGIVLIYLEP